MRARYQFPLALILVVVVGLTADFISSAGAVVGDGNPVYDKCCKPPTKSPPSPLGCPAPPCATFLSCVAFVDYGTWVDGGCQTLQDFQCMNSIGSLPKPKYLCTVTSCKLVDDSIGMTCGWRYLGDDPAQMQPGVQACNGDDCP